MISLAGFFVQLFVASPKNILEVADTVETEALSPIKGRLGNEYTYTDIQFAMAYKKLKS